MAFPGYPTYLEQAREALELSQAEVNVAKQQAAVNQIATLVVQALDRREGPHPDTLRCINELAYGLCLAAEGALLMRALVVKPIEEQTAKMYASSPIARNGKGGLRGAAAPQ